VSSYDDTIMDHIRNARNYRALPAAADVHAGEASNPLCGDTFTVYAKLSGDRIEDVAFECECCGISMASASVMTEWLRGRTTAEARAAHAAFEAAIRAGETRVDAAPADSGAILGFVKATPARTGCALIGWQALSAALRNDER
jgi:nitrogen fixation NifU-like protein